MYYSVTEVAKKFMVTPHSVRAWDAKGVLHPDFITPTGRRYYLKEKVDKMVREGEQHGHSDDKTV